MKMPMTAWVVAVGTVFVLGRAEAQPDAGASRASDQGAANQQRQSNEPGTVPVVSQGEVVRSTGIVQSKDENGRTVLLRDDSGRQFRVDVPANMSRFQTLKKGDRVDVTYYQATAVALTPPGAPAPTVRERSRIVEQTPGGELVGREVEATAKVVSIDEHNGGLRLKLPDGRTEDVTVTDAQARKKLSTLQPGQPLGVVYSEATATRLEPSSGNGHQRR
jgi:hypothetical protein